MLVSDFLFLNIKNYHKYEKYNSKSLQGSDEGIMILLALLSL